MDARSSGCRPPGTIPLTLVRAYETSWSRFLKVQGLQKKYQDHFALGDLQADIRRLSFTDPEVIQRFVTDHEMDFQLRPEDLPGNHRETKIKGVAVGLVGASSPSQQVSVTITHGSRYEQILADAAGTPVVQLLAPRTGTVPDARTTSLGADPVVFQPVDPLAPSENHAWWGAESAEPGTCPCPPTNWPWTRSICLL